MDPYSLKPDQWLDLLHDPQRLALVDVSEIKQWIHSYPYLGFLRILLAKRLQLGKDGAGYAEALASAAAQSRDRRSLYGQVREMAQASGEIRLPEPEEQAGTQHPLDPISRGSATETKIPEQPLNAGILVQIPIGDLQEVSQHPLESLQLVPKTAADSRKSVEAEAKSLPVEPREPSHTNEIKENTPVAHKGEAQHTTKALEGQQPEEDGFLAWLHTLKPVHRPQEVVIPEQKQAAERIKQEVREETSKRQKNLDPEKSLDLDVQIASETLAELYVRQGLIQQAIQTYERLQLKFPSKSTFFAGKIEQLKKS